MKFIDLEKSFNHFKKQFMSNKPFHPLDYTIRRTVVGNVSYLEKNRIPLFVIPDEYLEDMIKILSCASAAERTFPKQFSDDAADVNINDVENIL